MKVLHICSYYLGTDLYQRLFEALEKNAVEEDIYVFADHKLIVKKQYPSNVKVSKCYKSTDRIMFYIKHQKVLMDVQNKFNITDYNIIHAHSLFSNGYIAFELFKKYGVPYIVAVRNTDVNVFFKRALYLRRLGIDILINAKKIIFISEPYKEFTIKKYIPKSMRAAIQEKSIVIPNGIDEFWLKNKFEAKSMQDNQKVKIIYVGSIDNNKNISTTLNACKLLIKNGYDVSYKIIGRVMDRKYANLIGKHKFVEYFPYSPKEDIINHMRSSDIFVMPSRYETFGLVYAEAMSQGLPVIYSRGQGFDKQFNEGTVGYAVRYNSATEIAESIINIMNNYSSVSSDCIEKVNKFDWGKIAEQYLNIYEYNKKTLPSI